MNRHVFCVIVFLGTCECGRSATHSFCNKAARFGLFICGPATRMPAHSMQHPGKFFSNDIEKLVQTLVAIRSDPIISNDTIDYVTANLGHPHRLVRINAILTLKHLKSIAKKSLPHLRIVATNDLSQVIRIRAIEAVINIEADISDFGFDCIRREMTCADVDTKILIISILRRNFTFIKEKEIQYLQSQLKTCSQSPLVLCNLLLVFQEIGLRSVAVEAELDTLAKSLDEDVKFRVAIIQCRIDKNRASAIDLLLTIGVGPSGLGRRLESIQCLGFSGRLGIKVIPCLVCIVADPKENKEIRRAAFEALVTYGLVAAGELLDLNTPRY